jgi:hypothetical protein
MIISHLILLRMRIVSDKSCRENQITVHVQWLFSENHAIYEIIWKNMAEPYKATDNNKIWHMHFEC